MLASDRSIAFAEALTAKGVSLRTSAGQYRRAHELPGWYPASGPVTPAAVWTEGDGEEEFHAACERLGPGPAVLRDYVKPVKHYCHEVACIPGAVGRAAAWKVAARFQELQGDEFTGGFVLRRFERFISAEARTCGPAEPDRLLTTHLGTPGDLPPAIDLALRTDGPGCSSSSVAMST